MPATPTFLAPSLCNQARELVAAEGGAESSPVQQSAALHSYHSGRASRAARVIQSYLQALRHHGLHRRSTRMSSTFITFGLPPLQRVQRVQKQQQRASGEGSSDGGGDAPYTEEQLELIRRAQRAFRAHERQHNEEAQAVRQTLISSSAIDEEGERALCSIVRRAGAGEVLSAPEQAQLTRLQQALKNVLERRRR